MTVPTHSPTLLKSMREMTDDELDSLVEEIRKRRNACADALDSARTFSRNLSASGLRDRFQSQLLKAEKLLSDTNKKIDKLEESVLNVRALRLQLE